MSEDRVFGKAAKEAKVETEQDKYQPSEEELKRGAVRRPATAFHDKITADGSSGYKAEAGRYHLYVSYACPWAHRTLVVRAMKGLEDAIPVTVTDWRLGDFNSSDYVGWPFHKDRPDPLHPEFKTVFDLYRLSDPEYPHRSLSVPILFDSKTQKIVNNESSEIIVMFNTAFNEFAKHPELDLNPENLREKMEEMNAIVYPNINDGVYRCGFARQQEAYDDAVRNLWEAMDKMEEHLGHNRYLCGDKFTLSDVRFFTTLVRFDHVYHGHFKCNRNKLKEMPNLFAYTCEIYQMAGVKETVNMEHITHHYYWSHARINPTRVVPIGPKIEFDLPHNRADRSYD